MLQQVVRSSPMTNRPQTHERASRDETTDDATEDSVLKLFTLGISSLDPISGTEAISGVVIQQLFDGLFTYRHGDLDAVPELATDYSVSDDYRTHTFEVKQGVRFHDGSEVTAWDFVYSWERLAASPHSKRSQYLFDILAVEHETDDGEYRPWSLGVEATGRYELELRLRRPFHSVPELLAYPCFAPIPKGSVGDVTAYTSDLSQAEFARNPIGAGPFALETWEPGERIEATAVDGYHGDGPYIDGIHWDVLARTEDKYQTAVEKRVDLFGIPVSAYDPEKVYVEETDELDRRWGKYGPLENGSYVNYEETPLLTTFYLAFNADRVARPVRLATAYALNQTEMMTDVFRGRGQPAYHVTPPAIFPGGRDEYQNHAEREYPYGYDERRPDDARRVMRDAGFGPDDRYEFTFTYNQTSGSYPKLGRRLQEALADAFIDVRIEAIEYKQLLERGQAGDLDSYPLGWLMDWPAPDSLLQQLNPQRTDTSLPDPIVYTNWSDTDAADRAQAAWNRVIAHSRPTDDDEHVREVAYLELEQANWEDVVLLSLYHEWDPVFSYDHIRYPRLGLGGIYYLKHNETRIAEGAT